MKIHYNNQFLTAGCIYMGQMNVGYLVGWTAPVIPKLQDPEQTPLEEVLTDQQSALVGSIYFAGTLVGPCIVAHLSNIAGRKPCLFAAGVVTFISILMLALAKSVAVIYTARVLAGLGSSVVLIMSLVYIGEVASTSIRGILLTLVGLSTAVGTLLVYIIGPYVSYIVTCWLSAAMMVVYVISLYFIPESPVFYVMAGKNDEAIANLKSLGRESEINMGLATGHEKKSISLLKQLTDIFTIKSNRKAMFMVVTLLILQQLSGFYALVLFATTIFDMSGSHIPPHISTIILGASQVVSGIIAPFFVENVGRKPLLTFSTAICSLSLTALATYFYLYNISHPAADSLQWMSLTSLVVYVLGYSVGLGTIPNTFSGEMFTTNVRSLGTSVSLTVSWAVGFGVSTAFGYMVPAWGAAVTFWIYAGACAIAFVFTIVIVPETKGKTLLEVQEMLNK